MRCFNLKGVLRDFRCMQSHSLASAHSAACPQVSAVVQSSAEWGCVSSSSLMAATPNAIANSLLVDQLITSNVPLTNGGSQLSYINITDSNYKCAGGRPWDSLCACLLAVSKSRCHMCMMLCS